MAELNVIRSVEFIFPNIDAGATGRHVYYLLHSRGYKAKDVARILGFSDPQAVYNWKYGSRMPSIDNLDRLSRLLNISINDLLVHDGDEEVTVFLGLKKMFPYLFMNIFLSPVPLPELSCYDIISQDQFYRMSGIIIFRFIKDEVRHIGIDTLNTFVQFPHPSEF